MTTSTHWSQLKHNFYKGLPLRQLFHIYFWFSCMKGKMKLNLLRQTIQQRSWLDTNLHWSHAELGLRLRCIQHRTDIDIPLLLRFLDADRDSGASPSSEGSESCQSIVEQKVSPGNQKANSGKKIKSQWKKNYLKVNSA